MAGILFKNLVSRKGTPWDEDKFEFLTLCECGFVDFTTRLRPNSYKVEAKCPGCGIDLEWVYQLNHCDDRKFHLSLECIDGPRLTENELEKTVYYETDYRRITFDIQGRTIKSEPRLLRAEINFQEWTIEVYNEYPTPCKKFGGFNPWIGVGSLWWEPSSIYQPYGDLNTLFKRQLIDYWNKYMPDWKILNTPKSFTLRETLHAFSRFFENPHLTLLTQDAALEPFYSRLWIIGNWAGGFNLQGTNPREILGLTKTQLKIFKQNFLECKSSWPIEYIRKKYSILKGIEQNVGKHNMTILAKRWKRWLGAHRSSINWILESGVDREAFCRWLVNHPSQNRMTIHLGVLIDAIRMKLDMNEPIDTINIQRLLDEHDELARRYKLEEDEIKKEEMLKTFEIRKSLEWEKDQFKFTVPQRVSDFELESKELRHCVKSYALRHMDGELTIVMLRKGGKPYITIELDDNRVVQVKGKGNRAATEEEKALIKEWASINKIKY